MSFPVPGFLQQNAPDRSTRTTRRVIFYAPQNRMPSPAEIRIMRMGAVSYTHLDVYKRQNPEYVQQLAGYPLTGCPSAVQFIEMLYNALVRAA